MSRQSAQRQSGNSVVLEEDAGQSGWFRVMPRLRVQREGERVRGGDPVVLIAVENGSRLAMSVGRAGGRAELLTRDEDTDAEGGDLASTATFKLNVYRSVSEDALASSSVLCGMACTLYHQEMEALL